MFTLLSSNNDNNKCDFKGFVFPAQNYVVIFSGSIPKKLTSIIFYSTLYTYVNLSKFSYINFIDLKTMILKWKSI